MYCLIGKGFRHKDSTTQSHNKEVLINLEPSSLRDFVRKSLGLGRTRASKQLPDNQQYECRIPNQIPFPQARRLLHKSV